MRAVRLGSRTPMQAFAVVTGASSGIGFELDRQFHDNGFDVMVAGRGSRLLPDRAKAVMHGKQAEPGGGENS